MADFIGLGLAGVSDVFEMLDTHQKNVSSAVKVGVRKAARKVLQAIRTRCPVADQDWGHEPGNGKKSLKVKLLKPIKSGKATALIGPTVGKSALHDGWYLRLVNNGTSKAAANPFFDQGWGAAMSDSQAEMGQAMLSALDGVLEKDLGDAADIIQDSLGGGHD